MRDIIFRGKRIDNGEWVEGNYCAAEYITGDGIEHLIIEVPRNGCSAKINPKTVGQYTGLTDKNGKKIFEGDIVKTDKFSEPNKQYIIKYDLQFGAFIGQDRYNSYFVTFDGDSGEFEVIGNIHDNPELLKSF